MIRRRLLYLNAHSLAAYAWEGGQLLSEGVFESNENGLSEFSRYLSGNRRSHFSLLANVADESHVLETIPFVRGADRRALLARKLGQHFQGSPLTTASSVGFEKTQRKNEKVLLSALTNPSILEPWLTRITQAEAPLAGIYSVAQLSGTLLQKLGLTPSRCLLLSIQDHSIRETYLVDGRPHFSRTAPVSDQSVAGVAASFASESLKLHQYLAGQRLINRTDPLPIYIIAHPSSLPAIERACPNRGALTYAFIDSHVAADRLHVRPPPDDDRCDLLYLQTLATKPPRQQFATETQRHHHMLSRLRQGLIGAGILVMLGGGLYAAREATITHQYRTEMAGINAEEQDFRQRYQMMAASFPETGIDNQQLRQLTTQFQALAAFQRRPDQIFQQIAQALDQTPSVTLTDIDWKNGDFSPSTVGIAHAAPEIATIKATIHIDLASPRQILSTFDQFTERLTQPGTQIVVRQRPFDMDSSTALKGGDNVEESARPRAFVIDVIRSRTP